jgi:ribosome-associated protein
MGLGPDGGHALVADDVAGDLVVSSRLTIPADELNWRFSRSAGPGGQSVNTTDSRVELRWDARASRALDETRLARLLRRHPDGVVVVTASEQRSQWQNRRSARQRMAETVRRAVAAPPPSRRPTRPSRAAVERRLESKRRRSVLKQWRREPS